MTVSVLTLVRDREAHLRQLVEGLRRSARAPDELVVVDMGDVPLPTLEADFPIRIEPLRTGGLPLAAARNRAARAARGDRLLFLDVDCIPSAAWVGRMVEALDLHDGVLCADVRYLGPDDARGAWRETELLSRGRPHPVRDFPSEGTRVEQNPGLFWSLAFAIRRQTFERLGGFDEGFDGYGGEDTDFGFRAAAQGAPLLFVGGAPVFHQHHESHEPPVQHLSDIVRNAERFHARWGVWPMRGWLDAFAAMGLIAFDDASIRLQRSPTAAERESTRVRPQAASETDRIAADLVQSA